VDFDQASRNRFRLRFASAGDLPSLCEIESNIYAGESTLGDRGIREWFRANSEMFRIVEVESSTDRMSEWAICGYHLIAPLLNPFYERLITGAVQDFNLPATSLGAFSDLSVKALYVMDTLVDSAACPNSGIRRLAASYLTRDMIWRLVDLLDGYSNLREVSAIVASETGKNFVSKSGFREDARYVNPLGWKLWVASREDILHPCTPAQQRLVRTSTRFKSEYIA
jgi:hypothetical protein